MSDLNQIVNVQIARETTTIDRANFGTPLFLVEVSTVSDRVLSYSSLQQVLDDYSATDTAYKMASAAFSQEISPTTIKIAQKATAETYTEALNAVLAADDDWYALAAETITASEILLLAAGIEAVDKIYVARSADADIITSADDDIASDLNAAEYDRTILVYHSKALTEYADAAWIGNCIVRDPGSQTWMFKSLTGITFDALTTSQANFATGKKANVYRRTAGVNFTRNGTVSSGEYIDIIRGIDWLTAGIGESIATTLVNTPKLPYTNAGIAVIENLVREKLDEAVTQGLIAPEPAYTVTTVDVLATPSADRLAREYGGITFRARLAGAIHKVEINGTVFA